ncbi:MAG: hypothetical protein Edafosvirus1_97 [Edafosvirus sp.]|uniref:Uncharacterized protein n=1 Tax=Edafosvirus sp. TaxID=2487765 RepID=A0A3G4ZS95_9VIRU|nr:MAG: hypothetical protein Edafosvirus1_97 [Edafosvirus sp.]
MNTLQHPLIVSPLLIFCGWALILHPNANNIFHVLIGYIPIIGGIMLLFYYCYKKIKYWKMTKEELFNECKNDPEFIVYINNKDNTLELHEYIINGIEPFDGKNGFCVRTYHRYTKNIKFTEKMYKILFEKGYCPPIWVPEQYKHIFEYATPPEKLCSERGRQMYCKNIFTYSPMTGQC